MKKKLIFAVTLSAFSFAVTSAQAVTTAVTKPVGYHTITVESNASFPVFNLTGANFAKKILAAGEIDSIGTNTLDDAQADFTTAFTGVPSFDRDFGGIEPATPNLVVEVTSGPNAGLNTEVTSFTGTQLTTMDDLTGLASASETYIVREALTVADIFGPANEAALIAGNGNASTDKVWIPRGITWDKAYYNPGSAFPPVTAGWKVVGQGNVDVANMPVYFTNGFIIERVGPPNLDIVITGHVRVEPALVSIEFGFNAIDRLFPVGSTLANSGLDALTKGNSGVADVVWMPSAGTWLKYYYNLATAFPPTTEGWKLIGGGDIDRGSTPLTPGIIVERRTSGTNILFTPDPLYNNL